MRKLIAILVAAAFLACSGATFAKPNWHTNKPAATKNHKQKHYKHPKWHKHHKAHKAGPKSGGRK